MSTPDAWDCFGAELDRWQAAGRTARLWLRDDDAVEATAALDRLVDLTGRFDVPVLLAFVPATATETLARRLRHERHILPSQHGFSHRNHARKGEKAAELGPQRPVDVVLAELGDGRRRALDLFGERLRPVLVPPWNRIAPEIVPDLPEVGLSALSTFGWKRLGPFSGVEEINCHVDIIDWKGTRRVHPTAKVVDDMAKALATARASNARVGILTHHLVHDEPAWSLLDALFRFTAGHGSARWVSVDGMWPSAPP